MHVSPMQLPEQLEHSVDVQQQRNACLCRERRPTAPITDLVSLLQWSVGIYPFSKTAAEGQDCSPPVD